MATTIECAIVTAANARERFSSTVMSAARTHGTVRAMVPSASSTGWYPAFGMPMRPRRAGHSAQKIAAKMTATNAPATRLADTSPLRSSGASRGK
jgi:hypothetical protein